MTVGELIEALRGYPESMEVYVVDGDLGDQALKTIEARSFQHHGPNVLVVGAR